LPEPAVRRRAPPRGLREPARGMSLHRRPVGRARLLAALGALVMLVGTIPPWWTAGSIDSGIPPISGNALERAGIAVFLVALATLALITLPYASDRPFGLDRWWAYAVLALVGWLALLLRVVTIALEPGGLGTMTPDRAPGLWISAVGLAILARAAYQIYTEPG